MATLPAFLKTWNFTLINQRIPYVSLIDAAESVMYGLKNYLVATMGASVWGSSDGTTGDNTDRWASKANVATQAADTVHAASWCVIAWAGGQLCLSYVGATNDIFRVSFSQGSLFTLAGTHTFTPTATDEAVIATGLSLVGSTTSQDRVFSVVAASDRSVFRIWVLRQATQLFQWGMEQVAEGPGVTAGTIMGWNSNVGIGANLSTAGVQVGTGNGSAGAANCMLMWYGGAARALFGGTVAFNGTIIMANVFTVPNPELNTGSAAYPVVVGCAAASNQGWMGTRYDMFFSYGTGNNVGDAEDDVSAGTRAIWVPGAFLQPWDSTKGFLQG